MERKKPTEEHNTESQNGNPDGNYALCVFLLSNISEMRKELDGLKRVMSALRSLINSEGMEQHMETLVTGPDANGLYTAHGEDGNPLYLFKEVAPGVFTIYTLAGVLVLSAVEGQLFTFNGVASKINRNAKGFYIWIDTIAGSSS
jgi:hypothetical protein